MSSNNLSKCLQQKRLSLARSLFDLSRRHSSFAPNLDDGNFVRILETSKDTLRVRRCGFGSDTAHLRRQCESDGQADVLLRRIVRRSGPYVEFQENGISRGKSQ